MWELAKIKFRPGKYDKSQIKAIIDFSCLFPGIGVKMLTGHELQIKVNAFKRDCDFPGYDKSAPLDSCVLQVNMIIPSGEVKEWLEMLNGSL